jgi:hypothetical protein
MATSDRSVGISADIIRQSILLLREKRVMLSQDLAALYDVETRALNQAVRRNAERFPPDFMFALTRDEIRDLSQSVISLGMRHARNIYAFTEPGIAMLSGVLNTPRAIRANIEIMRAFIRMREMLASNKELAKKLEELEHKLASHDQAIVGIFKALRDLMEPRQTRAIGFTASLRKVD